MPKIHPHAEAIYRVIPLEDGSFGVEVTIPENYPTTVSAFGSEADAGFRELAHGPGQVGIGLRRISGARPGPDQVRPSSRTKIGRVRMSMKDFTQWMSALSK